MSLTYDDGRASQLDFAVPQLNAHRLSGTFFVTQENIQGRLNEWLETGRQGHEIANHTVTHPCDLQRFSPERFIDREVGPMRGWLDRNFGRRWSRTYAYPCDVTDLGPGTANAQAKRYAALLHDAGIAAARTSEGEPNSPHYVRSNPYRLHALALGYDASDQRALSRYLDMAQRKGHWAILVIHDVVPHPHSDDQISTSLHNSLLDIIVASRLWCAPLGEVFDYLGDPTG